MHSHKIYFNTAIHMHLKIVAIYCKSIDPPISIKVHSKQRAPKALSHLTTPDGW